LLAESINLNTFIILQTSFGVSRKCWQFSLPAEFEVGEHYKVALLSVTEGEDKPLKYPLMFQEADCLLITKMDLAPYLEIDISRIEANIRQMNPNAAIIPVSAKTGAGLENWLNWVRLQLSIRQQFHTDPIQQLLPK
jgi:hydrogenase accessory protein HypB